jgi:hypothetical protein
MGWREVGGLRIECRHHGEHQGVHSERDIHSAEQFDLGDY